MPPRRKGLSGQPRTTALAEGQKFQGALDKLSEKNAWQIQGDGIDQRIIYLSEWVSAKVVEKESVALQKVRGGRGGRPHTAPRRTRNSDGHPDEGNDDGNGDAEKEREPQNERRRRKIQEPEQPRRRRQQQRQPEGRQPQPQPQRQRQRQRDQRQRRGSERQEQQDSPDEIEQGRPEEEVQEQAEEEDQEQAEKENQEQSVEGDQEQSEESSREQLEEEDQEQQEESSQEQPEKENQAIVEDEATAHSRKGSHFKRSQRGWLEVQQSDQQHQPGEHPKQQLQRQEQLQLEQGQRLRQQTDEGKGTELNGSMTREEDEGSPTIQPTNSGIEEGRWSLAHHVNNHHRHSVNPSTPNQQIMTTETNQQTIQYPMTPQMSTQHSNFRSFQSSPALHIPNENGIHQLLNAFDLPEMPARPLRLSAVSIENPSLEQTKYEILGISTIASLPQSKRRIVIEFVGSLFSPKTYWDLRNNVCMIVSNTGLSNTEPEEEKSERHRSNNSHPYSADGQRLPSDPPAYLTSFVERWRKTLNFSHSTATPALIKIMKTWNEMQCYEHWSRLLAIWNQCRNGYIDEDQDGGVQDDNSNSWDERVEYRAEDVKALRIFLYNEIERRRSEPGFGNIAMANKVSLLKTLVAPYLGFPISLLDSPMGNGTGERGGASNPTRKIFNKLWNNTMTRGKGAHFLVKWLGCGALAVAGRTILINIGSHVLQVISPILFKNYPSLRKLLDTLYEAFLLPIQSGKQLSLRQVGSFMRIGSVDMLTDICAKEPHGLIGLFQGGDRAIEPQALEDFATPQEIPNSVEDFGAKRGLEGDDSEGGDFDPEKLLGNGDNGSGNEKEKEPLTPPISGQKRTATTTIERPSKRR
ncbi:MAG: hypothetical protein Q9214_004864 [Letrouitia sp. 1 TL-2023]